MDEKVVGPDSFCIDVPVTWFDFKTFRYVFCPYSLMSEEAKYEMLMSCIVVQLRNRLKSGPNRTRSCGRQTPFYALMRTLHQYRVKMESDEQKQRMLDWMLRNWDGLRRFTCGANREPYFPSRMRWIKREEQKTADFAPADLLMNLTTHCLQGDK